MINPNDRKRDAIKRKLLRNKATKAEKILWERIRKRQIAGARFRRQFSLKGFVVDFYSLETRLALEIDGAYHQKKEQKEYDAERQALLEELDIVFLRFTNEEIFHNINEVLRTIKKTVEERFYLLDKPPRPPLPSVEARLRWLAEAQEFLKSINDQQLQKKWAIFRQQRERRSDYQNIKGEEIRSSGYQAEL